jgi:hypothetical protein
METNLNFTDFLKKQIHHTKQKYLGRNYEVHFLPQASIYAARITRSVN